MSLLFNRGLPKTTRTAIGAVFIGSMLVLSGCVSSGSNTSGYGGPSISSATAKQTSASKSVSEYKRAVKRAKADLRKLERRIARAERVLKRRKLSEKRRETTQKDLKSDKRSLRSAKRAVSRGERRLARAERSFERAKDRVASAKRRKIDADRARADAEKRESQERARAALKRRDTDEDVSPRRSRLFSLSDPALKNVGDYRARVDNSFPIAAIPVAKMNKRLYRQEVKYRTKQRPGTIVVDTGSRYLYLVQSGGKAIRYGIGVGKAGFAWSGSAHIGWKQQWPKWTPPDEMIERRPDLEKWSVRNGGMPGGPQNPLGARALYLMKDGKDTLYRLHGTPQWASIGTAASSGCIRLINQDVIDLYQRVPNGTKVVVM